LLGGIASGGDDGEGAIAGDTVSHHGRSARAYSAADRAGHRCGVLGGQRHEYGWTRPMEPFAMPEAFRDIQDLTAIVQ
jgi:hypothetical protein